MRFFSSYLFPSTSNQAYKKSNNDARMNLWSKKNAPNTIPMHMAVTY